MRNDDGLIEQSINRRKLNFFLLTEDEMSSLRANTIAGDLLFAVASICLSAALTGTAQTIFFLLGGASLLGSLIFYWGKASTIRRVKASGTIQSASTSNSSRSEIIDAEYGANGIWVSITDRVRAALRGGGPVIVSNGLSGSDPVPHVKKHLRVRYRFNGEEFTKDFPEDGPIELPPGVL